MWSVGISAKTEAPYIFFKICVQCGPLFLLWENVRACGPKFWNNEQKDTDIKFGNLIPFPSNPKLSMVFSFHVSIPTATKTDHRTKPNFHTQLSFPFSLSQWLCVLCWEFEFPNTDWLTLKWFSHWGFFVRLRLRGSFSLTAAEWISRRLWTVRSSRWRCRSTKAYVATPWICQTPIPGLSAESKASSLNRFQSRSPQTTTLSGSHGSLVSLSLSLISIVLHPKPMPNESPPIHYSLYLCFF